MPSHLNGVCGGRWPLAIHLVVAWEESLFCRKRCLGLRLVALSRHFAYSQQRCHPSRHQVSQYSTDEGQESFETGRYEWILNAWKPSIHKDKQSGGDTLVPFTWGGQKLRVRLEKWHLGSRSSTLYDRLSPASLQRRLYADTRTQYSPKLAQTYNTLLSELSRPSPDVSHEKERKQTINKWADLAICTQESAIVWCYDVEHPG